MSVANSSEWFRSAFSQDYLKIYAHRDTSEAERAIATIVDGLRLPTGSPCLDLCCGFGRHIPPLESAGLSVVGCDLSMDLLSNSAHGRARLVRGDMRALPFADGAFHAVFSFFTSFGYFLEDRENEDVVIEIARLLSPSGFLIMDFLNPDVVRASLVPEDCGEYDDFRLTQRRWIDESVNTVNKDLIVKDADGERRYHERVKLYGAQDFQRFFAAAGLRIVRTMGDYDGSSYSEESPRQIYLAEKT